MRPEGQEWNFRMKLAQNQTWKTEGQCFRIVKLERLAVHYKALSDHPDARGTHHHVTKKEFCRLIKSATLVPSGH